MQPISKTEAGARILAVLKAFNYAPKVSNMALKQFCERSGYGDYIIGEGEYQDYLFQYQHDVRVGVIVPQVLAILSKYQYQPDFIGEAEAKRIRTHNDDLEWEIAKVCEDAGIVYKEIDTVVKNISQVLSSIVDNAGNRMNNMASVVLATLAKDKFGEQLALSDLGTFYRERADELGIKLHDTQK